MVDKTHILIFNVDKGGYPAYFELSLELLRSWAILFNIANIHCELKERKNTD